MNMIWHSVYYHHFMPIIPYNRNDILVEPILPFRLNQALPKFNCKDKMDMNLSVCIGHYKL